ncbi:MAG: tetratricopeptide repeat protein, partial [Elusimicrobiota bacterium]|nr:tetratricopeptide repeat protein [Elusimicrobiota bacterium]
SASVLAFLLFCLSNFPLRIIPTSVMLFSLMGITQALPTPGPNSSTKFAVLFTRQKVNRLLRIIIVLICILVAYKFVVLPFSADISRHKGDKAVMLGDLQTAIKEYEKSIKLDYVHSERTSYDLGEIYRKLNQIDNAIQSYNVSVDIRNYSEVYNCLGNCYWLKKDIPKAIENWEIAVRLGLPDEKDQKIVEDNLVLAKKMLK